jgi:anti-sigma regulatory factor (Ser/Thr protein kinase)/GAF domain-containing protein
VVARLERRVQLPPSPRSLLVARTVLRTALAEAGQESLSDVTLLLATELCTNAVQHAGTELELSLTIDDSGLTVGVTDRRPVPLELSQVNAVAGNGSSGGYGLRVVATLASSWGTRHDANGRHLVWFTLTTSIAGSDAGSADAALPEPAPAPGHWPSPQACRWLLHMPGPVAARLEVPALVSELLRRLCEVIGAEAATVSLDYGDGKGEQVLACHDERAEPHPTALATPGFDVRLALDAPLRGRLRLHGKSRTAVNQELADLCAHRIALAIESDWLRGTDRRRRSWMTYLAETSELLAQSLDVHFTAALVPQIVVPRLGEWCAVHLLNGSGPLTPTTWGHADESALAPLRSWLDDEGALQPRIDEARRSRRPVTFTAPVEGVSVALIARNTTLGTLTVGRPGRGSHTPEDVAIICDIARRAALAIANAQLNAAHVTVSQAFQQALLPRALPVSDRIEFAAEYLPASAGTDVGGDFYDVLALPEDRWLVAVGDVCGKGAPAAARTGRIRDVLRVLVRDGCRLERAVRLLNDAMGEPVSEQQFCTLAGAVISSRPDAPGLDLELVLAGHEKPVLLRADGTCEYLGEYGTPVGLLDEIRLCTTRHSLQRGDAMVIYTDGVTERRHDTEFFGRTRLAELVARMTGASAATMAAALRTAVKDFSPDPPKDDIALLVVKAR